MVSVMRVIPEMDAAEPSSANVPRSRSLARPPSTSSSPKKRPSASELVDWWFDVEAASGACGFGGRVARQPGGLPPLDPGNPC